MKNTALLSCGCGRPVPMEAVRTALAKGARHLVCTGCGARGDRDVLVSIALDAESLGGGCTDGRDDCWWRD